MISQPTPPNAVRNAIEDAFAKGFRTAANWASRSDLRADIGSPAYIVERDALLASHMESCACAAEREPGFIKPDTDTHVYFYEQDCYVLSNFSAFNLQWKGLTFHTSEAAYHFEKFVGPHAESDRLWDIREQILKAASAHEAYKIAERNFHFRRPDWNEVRVSVMRAILSAKAQQHEYVRRKLIDTGERILIEDSWRDDFWGWGPSRDGKNVLGKLWMEVRAELRAHLGAVGDTGDMAELRRLIDSQRQPARKSTPQMPMLPDWLLNAIGEYGMARTDRVSDVEIQHRWEELIRYIKRYAADCVFGLGSKYSEMEKK